MPLKAYKRPDRRAWWVKGRVEYNSLAISDYIRCSTGALSEAGAADWIAQETERQTRRHLLGDEAQELTISDVIQMYPAKPKDAKRLLVVVEELGKDFLQMPVKKANPKYIRELGYKVKPDAATDTMWREVVTPIRAAINNAHELGKCNYIHVKRYSTKERIDQDIKRGKQSRVERKASDQNWIAQFCKHADIYNAALVRFMFETAARIDQATSLVPADLDLMNKRVWLKAAKGHEAQWVAISHDMMIELANLPPKQPVNSKLGYRMEPRVFGYASSTGYTTRWQTICKRAGIEYLPAHQAGRHGFYTELRVRQGVDPITAAKAGRWADASLPDRAYAHAEDNQAELREAIRSTQVKPIQAKPVAKLKQNKTR